MNRPSLALAALLSLPMLAGCSYVHFGRQPAIARDVLEQNTRLEAEKTQLERELALSQQQGTQLRALLDNSPQAPAASRQLVADLNETTRQLAALRTEYARLQAEQARVQAAPSSAGRPAGDPAEVRQQLTDTENKLAAALRTYTVLQEENAGLREQLDRTQAQNAQLTTQVSTLTTQNREVQSALAQANSELLAQQQARARATQEAEALRTQLGSANERIASLTAARSSTAGSAQAISSGLAMNAETSARTPTAQLETSAAQARARAGTASAADTDALVNELSALRARVGSLETERANLQRLVATSGPAAATGGAATDSDSARLAVALRSYTVLQDENDSLRAQNERIAAEKTAISAELARTQGSTTPAAQASALRDQLRQAQTQAAALADENSRLKARLGAPSPAVPAGTSPTRPGATVVQATPPAGPPTIRSHVIAEGDTLARISRQYYGTDARWTDILAANRDILRDERSLVIGRVIRIP